MSRRREPPLVPSNAPRAGELIGRRRFVRTAGGILVATAGLDMGCSAIFGPDVLAKGSSISPNPPDPSQCTVSVSASTVNVGSAVTLTLQAKDSSGIDIGTGGATVVFGATGGTSAGTVGATTDQGDGTYTATYTATGAGTAQTIVATIGGSTVTTTMPTVTVVAGVQAPDPSKCTVRLSAGSVAVGKSVTITLQAKDSSGNNIARGGATVVFTATGGTSTGTISATTDQGDGTYTATYTGTATGSAQTIHATINGAAVTTPLPTITVTATAQVPDPTKCTVSVTPSQVSVGGTATLTLQAKDSTGANLTSGGATVLFSATGGTSAGTISTTTDHGNGTYTATYTGTGAGTAQTIHATINGANVTTTLPTVTVTGSTAAPDPTKCTVTVGPATIAIGGTATLTLQAKDSTGANITVGGATVTFAATGGTSAGTISTVVDHGNGTYAATYTGTAAGTAQTIGATINGAAVSTTMPTITVSAGFQAPNIINNYGFESGSWGPFNDGGAGSVSGAVIATDFAYEGTHSAKYAFSPSGGDSGANMYSGAPGSYDRLWVRVYMRLTNRVTTTWKFIRFYNPSISGGGKGGVWIDGSTGNGIICVGWDEEDQAIITTIGLTQAQVIDGSWHSLEVDFQRNGGASGFPEAAFWWDGQPQYPELNGHSTVNYYGSGNKSTWVNGRINAGERASSDKIAVIEWMGTLNGGNSASGQCNLDYVGVSSLGRIGP